MGRVGGGRQGRIKEKYLLSLSSYASCFPDAIRGTRLVAYFLCELYATTYVRI